MQGISHCLIGSWVLWISYELGVWNRWVPKRLDGQMELNKISHENMETQHKLGHVPKTHSITDYQHADKESIGY